MHAAAYHEFDTLHGVGLAGDLLERRHHIVAVQVHHRSDNPPVLFVVDGRRLSQALVLEHEKSVCYETDERVYEIQRIPVSPSVVYPE